MDDTSLRPAPSDAGHALWKLLDTRAALREFLENVARGRAGRSSTRAREDDVERQVARGEVPRAAEHDTAIHFDAPRDYAIRRDAPRTQRYPDNLVFAAFDAALAVGREWVRASPAAAPVLHYQQLAQRRLARSMREHPLLTLGGAFLLGAVALRLRPSRMFGAASTLAIGAWKLSRSPLVAALATVGPGAVLKLWSARASAGAERADLGSHRMCNGARDRRS